MNKFLFMLRYPQDINKPGRANLSSGQGKDFALLTDEVCEENKKV
jgi:hypothetical protein